MDSGQRFASYPSLKDRVTIVTGGASGIGASIVEAFARQRATVAFLDIQKDAAEQLRRSIDAQGGAVPEFHPCDVTDTRALQRCIEKVLHTHGTVDVLVNNAGNDTRHSIEGVTPESWDSSIAINLKHLFFASQAVIPAMKRAARGSIVNIGSIAWVIPSTGVPVYATAKAAIVGLSRTLAHELGGHNIRVNCVMPGAILTERQQRLWLTPEYRAEVLRNQAIKRMILPEEVAQLVLFLAADDSSAITSQSYAIDGGWV